MKMVTIYCLLSVCILVVTNALEFNSSSLNGKLITSVRNPEPVNIKYTALFRRNETSLCIGCLISVRHIISSAGCIMEVLKASTCRDNIFDVTAMIGRKNYKIIYAVYHSDYNHKQSWATRQCDVGMALIDGIIFPTAEVHFADLSDRNPKCMSVADLVGRSSFRGNSHVVEKVEVEIIDFSICQEAYNLDSDDDLALFCGISVNPKDILFNIDGGSPLVQNDELVGLLIFIKRMRSNRPLLFIRSSKMKEYAGHMKKFINRLFSDYVVH